MLSLNLARTGSAMDSSFLKAATRLRNRRFARLAAVEGEAESAVAT